MICLICIFDLKVVSHYIFAISCWLWKRLPFVFFNTVILSKIDLFKIFLIESRIWKKECESSSRWAVFIVPLAVSRAWRLLLIHFGSGEFSGSRCDNFQRSGVDFFNRFTFFDEFYLCYSSPVDPCLQRIHFYVKKLWKFERNIFNGPDLLGSSIFLSILQFLLLFWIFVHFLFRYVDK